MMTTIFLHYPSPPTVAVQSEGAAVLRFDPDTVVFFKDKRTALTWLTRAANVLRALDTGESTR